MSRQAVLNAVNLHFPELLSWSTWCYGQYPILWHTLGSITSESGVQQGDTLGPLLFCLVLHQVVCAIATDSECASLFFHRWYIDDGVVAGPISAVLRVLSIIKDLGPPLGLHINLSKCKLFSVNDLSRFPDEMKKSNVPHFEILGAPIGDFLFCAKYIGQKCTDASKLLQQLAQVGSSDPHIAMLLLRQCGGFCRLIHLAKTIPPSLAGDALSLFDDEVRQCFAECTAVDTPDFT